MDFTEVVSSLKGMANTRAVEIWTDFGVKTADEFYGVQLTQLKDFARKVKKNHNLSLELWQSGIHDAKLLATMIEEPKKVSSEQLDRQIKDISTPDLADKYCSNVAAKTAFAVQKMAAWTQSEEEMIKRAGFMLLAGYAKSNENEKDTFFEPYLQQIALELQPERNWVKEAMNYALIAIGSRSAYLKKKAIEVASAIGKVKIDYGKTSCKNPDAMAVLNKIKFES